MRDAECGGARMSKLPQRVWLPLSDAADFICKKCGCSIEDARQALLDAFRDGQINARGTIPNPVYKRALAEGRDDRHWRSAFPPLVGRRLEPEQFWQHDPNWQNNTVGEVSEVTVNRASLLRWLGEDDAARLGLSSAYPEPEPGQHPEEMASTIEHVAVNRSPLTHSGMAGRSTAKHLYLSELKRRAEVGTMCEGVVAESRELHDWLQQAYPEINPGTPKAIENNIRARYRELKAQRPQNKPPK